MRLGGRRVPARTARVELDARLGQQSDRVEHFVQVGDGVCLRCVSDQRASKSPRSSSVKWAATS